MKTLDLVPGSPEWHAHRATHFNASDAPAMMGCSKHKTRTQLLHELKTGIAPEVDAATQHRFDDGHRFEALARPLAAQTIGETLYVVVGTEGEISASFDGLTIGDDTAWEHKTLNDELRATMTTMDGAALPLAYRVQMEQQCMVSGCEKVLFMATRWHGGDLAERREAWYLPDLALRAQIVAGWEQFARDLAAYVPTEPIAPKPLGNAREALPALLVEAEGKLTNSNLDAYKSQALAVIGAIPGEPETDQQYADAKVDAEFCRSIQSSMTQAKEFVLGRMTTVDEAIKAIDFIFEAARVKAVKLENAVEAEEKRRKQKMQTDAIALLKAHIDALNVRIGKTYMPAVAADFAAAVKNKRSVASMQDAIDTTLAHAKIEASAIADRIDANLKHLAAESADHSSLFPDVASIVLKAADDFAALVQFRVADFKAKEERREADELAKAVVVVAEPVAAPVAAPAPAVIAMPVRAAAVRASPGAPPALGIGTINERLQHFTVTEAGLRGLGFEPAGRERAAPRYHDVDFPHMLAAIVAHVQGIQARQAA